MRKQFIGRKCDNLRHKQIDFVPTLIYTVFSENIHIFIFGKDLYGILVNKPGRKKMGN